MKRIIAIAFLASVVVAAASSAEAQTESRVTIPFAFQLGSASMPAGDYRVVSTSEGALWVRSKDGRQSATVLANTTSGSTAPARKLVFNRYGSYYFLSAVLDGRGENQKTFAPSKLEQSIRAEEASLNHEGQVLLAVK